MNLLKIEPDLLLKKIDNPIRSYQYTCFNDLIEYNIPINIYSDYLLSIEEFKLKNIWNHIIVRWNKMKLQMVQNKEFQSSEYSKNNYQQIHTNLNDEELNELLNKFSNKNHFKSIFAINCIQNYIYPI
tara:strand:+ start:3413 stop:3796 length:384 start_codon:yes stop_codon:yes gene_type:complete